MTSKTAGEIAREMDRLLLDPAYWRRTTDRFHIKVDTEKLATALLSALESQTVTAEEVRPRLSAETVQSMKEHFDAWGAMSYDPKDEDDASSIRARTGCRFLLEQHLKEPQTPYATALNRAKQELPEIVETIEWLRVQETIYTGSEIIQTKERTAHIKRAITALEQLGQQAAAPGVETEVDLWATFKPDRTLWLVFNNERQARDEINNEESRHWHVVRYVDARALAVAPPPVCWKMSDAPRRLREMAAQARLGYATISPNYLDDVAAEIAALAVVPPPVRLTMEEAGNLFADLSDLNVTEFEAWGEGNVPQGALDLYELGKKVRAALSTPPALPNTSEARHD